MRALRASLVREPASKGARSMSRVNPNPAACCTCTRRSESYASVASWFYARACVIKKRSEEHEQG